jgi:hypothetical protein
MASSSDKGIDPYAPVTAIERGQLIELSRFRGMIPRRQAPGERITFDRFKSLAAGKADPVTQAQRDILNGMIIPPADDDYIAGLDDGPFNGIEP